MRGPKRFPWQDEYDGSLTPGWAITFLGTAILVVGGLGLWLNDMHMNGYGIFSRPGMMP